MKINEIKYLPATNAVGKVYADATGVPFIGELMCAAAGNGGEPTPPTPSVVESVTVHTNQTSTSDCQMYGIGESCYQLVTVITLNQDWITTNCSPNLCYNMTIKDSSDNTIAEISDVTFWNCDNSNVAENADYQEGSMPTFPESGNYVLSFYDFETPDIHIFDGTGTWTYQAPQI